MSKRRSKPIKTVSVSRHSRRAWAVVAFNLGRGARHGVGVSVVALLTLAAATACTGRQQEAPPAPATAASPSAADAPIPDTASPLDALPEGVRLVADKPFTGDFDEMVKRRAIRVGVTFNRTHYFIDKGQERGLTYEALKSFENDLNTDLKTGNLKVHVVIVPMSRDLLRPSLLKGKVDMIAAMVTVRPELEAIAAFSEPTRTNVSQVVVTGPERRRSPAWTIWPARRCSSEKRARITTPSAS